MPTADRLYKMQKFPVYYPGVAQFKDSDSNPSGVRGARARVEIGLNNRPHEIIGVRIVNSYARFPIPYFDTQAPPDDDGTLPPPTPQPGVPDLCCLLNDLDDEQSVSIELAQQNVVVRDIHQRTLTGKNGIHWHPFPCSYPFRGGNNITITLTRLQSYPAIVQPTAFVTVFGWMYVSDELPPGGPPSTDFNEPAQGATGY